MILSVLLLSTKKEELSKVKKVYEFLCESKIMFNCTLSKNYEENYNGEEKINCKTLNLKPKQMINNFLNDNNSNILILDLSFDIKVLEETIKVVQCNINKDIIYFYKSKSKFLSFFEKLERKLFGLFLKLKEKDEYLNNIQGLMYISFKILKVMRMCDSPFDYLRQFNVFEGYDILNYYFDKNTIKTNGKDCIVLIYPLILLLIMGITAVLCVNMIKFFYSTNTILNILVLTLFAFVIMFSISFGVYYHIKYKNLVGDK